MDPIFQTLLFSTNKGGDSSNNTNGESMTTTILRPSRYATLTPREALRLDVTDKTVDDKRKEGKKEKSEEVHEMIQEDEIDVYRMNDGRLELVPHDDYNVVYLEESAADNQQPEQDASRDKQPESEAMDVDTTNETQDDSSTQQLFYIVHKPHQTSMSPPPKESDDTSTTSSTLSYETPPSIDMNNKLSLEAHMAQTLTRALVQRTKGYDSIRRNYGLDEQEREEKKRKKKKKADAAAKDEDDEEEKKGHKLLSSLAGISDGDDAETLRKLTEMRQFQERQILPQMHGINLENWEEMIDWEGGVSSDDEERQNVKKEMYNPETADCTPDFYSEPLQKPKGIKRPHAQDPLQILQEPRNPRLEALDLCNEVDWEGACSDSDTSYTPPHVPLILQSSTAGLSVAPLLAPLPSSRPLPFESHANYQSRYDAELSSELTAAELQSNIPGGSEALERYKEMRQRKREQMAKDKQSRVTEVMSALSLTGTGRRITSSLMGPGGAERTGRPSRHAMGSSSAHDAEYVEQLEFIYNHNIAKPELTLSEYRQFHRPRLPLAVVSPSCTWQFQTKVVSQNKGTRGMATASDGSTMIGSYHSMMAAGSKGQGKIKNEADLSPSMGDLVIMEYSEERPPLIMSKGMTCRIVNYYRGDRARCPISAGGGDRPLRKRHGDKAATAKGPEPAGPSGRMERPPRLLGPNQYTLKSAADLIGIISKAKKSKNKEAAALEAKKMKERAVDILPEGVTEILHPKVHGPFIGEVEEGKTQTGLISNLFAASMFRHDSEPTDFLMVLGQPVAGDPKKPSTGSGRESSSGYSEIGVVLRPFPPNIFCVGQTEPRVKVFAPGTNEEKKFVNAFIGYHCAKQIELVENHSVGSGLTFDSIKEGLFSYSKIPATQLRIRLKQVANFDRSDEGIWKLKRIGQDNFPGVEALGRKVSPEGIAAYESELAAIQRLKDLGLKDLYNGANNLANIATVMIYLNGAAQAALERKIKMKKVLDIKKRQKSPLLPYYEKAFTKLDHQHKEVKKRQEIAKFIYQELQLAPWNISGEFIDVHKRAQGSAMMKLTGIGDPSGVGEAFSLLREDERKPNKALLSHNDGALNAQIKKITGTENDLRKLTMKQMASLLRSYGMKDKQISVLKRWDRVHVIRDLSTKAASDGMGDEMERFARGEKLRLSDQRENYKKRVQEIWRRQIAALSSSDAVNDAPARSDLALGSAKESSEADAESDTGKGKPDSDDSDDDDEFAAMMEMEMTSTGEANRLVAAQLGDSSMRSNMDAQELSKEARELAALQRQREEERAMQSGLEQKVTGDRPDKKSKYQKVIRRKVIKTNLDGTQTITFEFIVDKSKVEELVTKLRSGQDDKKKKRDKQDSDYAQGLDDQDEEDTCVGHAFWEDEDNAKKKGSRKLKLKVSREVKMPKARGGPRKAAHSKLSSLTKHTHTEKMEQRKKKRMKLQEEKDLYKAHKTKGTSNRKERGAARDRMPHVILSDRLESIRASVEARPNAAPFHKPVSRELYPQYYEMIHDPIDLQTIREQNRKYDYKKANSFLRDFDLMKKNAANFNGKGTPLANEAAEIYEFVKRTIEENREEFDQMEEAVEDQVNNGRKKKKLKAKKTETPKAPAMNTAHIVVDGIETQVNLGTNLTFGFGGDDSDSDDN